MHALSLRQPLGNALDLGAFALVLVTIGKGGEQADGDDGLGFGWGQFGLLYGDTGVRLIEVLKVPCAQVER